MSEGPCRSWLTWMWSSGRGSSPNRPGYGGPMTSAVRPRPTDAHRCLSVSGRRALRKTRVNRAIFRTNDLEDLSEGMRARRPGARRDRRCPPLDRLDLEYAFTGSPFRRTLATWRGSSSLSRGPAGKRPRSSNCLGSLRSEIRSRLSTGRSLSRRRWRRPAVSSPARSSVAGPASAARPRARPQTPLAESFIPSPSGEVVRELRHRIGGSDDGAGKRGRKRQLGWP